MPVPEFKFDGGPTWQAPDLTGKKMLLWGLQYDPHIERYRILAQTFSDHTGATVEVQPQGWPLDQKIMTALASAPAQTWYAGWACSPVPIIKQQGIVPVDDLVFKPLGLDVKKWFRPGASGAYFQDGKYWGVPVEDNGDGFSVTGRLDLVAAADDASKSIWANAEKNTWFDSYEEMWDLAKALQKKDDKGNFEVMGLTSQGWNMHSITSIMRSLGTLWWDPDRLQFNMNSDAAVQALDLLVTKPFGLGIEAPTGDQLVNTFVAGKAVLARGNFSAAGEAIKLNLQASNVIAPSPVAGKDPLFMGEGGWGFEMPAKVPNQEVGIEFMKFMCTYEAQHIFSQIYGGGMPSCNAVADSDIYQGDDDFKAGQRRCVKALANCVFFGWGYGSQGDVGTAFDESIGALREGKMTSKEAAKAIQDRCIEQLDQFKSQYG